MIAYWKVGFSKTQLSDNKVLDFKCLKNKETLEKLLQEGKYIFLLYQRYNETFSWKEKREKSPLVISHRKKVKTIQKM